MCILELPFPPWKEETLGLFTNLILFLNVQISNKRKVWEIEETNLPADNAKWKRKDKHFNKLTKHRRAIYIYSL